LLTCSTDFFSIRAIWHISNLKDFIFESFTVSLSVFDESIKQNPGDPVTSGQIWYVFQSEFVFTFLLAFVVLNVATDQRNSNNQFYGACIGTTLMLAAFTVGSISGCIINPAVWVGAVCAASAAAKKNEPFFVYHFYVFWLAEFCGGAFAGILFNTFIKNSQADGKALENETFQVADMPDNTDGVVTDDKIKTEMEMR